MNDKNIFNLMDIALPLVDMYSCVQYTVVAFDYL